MHIVLTIREESIGSKERRSGKYDFVLVINFFWNKPILIIYLCASADRSVPGAKMTGAKSLLFFNKLCPKGGDVGFGALDDVDAGSECAGADYEGAGLRGNG